MMHCVRLERLTRASERLTHANSQVGSSNSRASPGSPVSVGRPAIPVTGSSQAKPALSLSVDVPATTHTVGGVETPSKSKRRRVKREDDDL